MRILKRLLGVALIPILLINVFVFQPAKADDTYSPDNSNKPDPLQSVKHLQRNLHVGEFSGAAVYDYQVTLPAGRNGLTPAVQLTYNSQDSSLHNIVGYRWNLNLNSIKRFNKNGLEKMYVQNDFVANTPIGSGELTTIQLNDGQHGHYGQKVERSFAKYEYREDGSWVVTDKQGTQYIFGQTEDARQFDPDDPSRIYQWMLEEIRDQNDNFIRYTYFKADNQIYPKTIHYTGHGNEDGVFEVRFLPFADGQTGDARQDSHFGYNTGFQVTTNYLVTGIRTYSEGVLRKKYQLNYTNMSPLVRKTIGSISETGYGLNGNTTLLPPTAFEYTPSSVRWELTDDYQPNWFFESCHYSCNPGYVLYWDMTGDGLVDFEYVNNNGDGVRAVNDGKGGFNLTNSQFVPGPYGRNSSTMIPSLSKKAIDFDGDGRSDIVRSTTSRDPHTHEYSVQSSINLARGATYSNTILIGFTWPEHNKQDNGASIADLNGDGLPDVIQSHYLSWGGPTGELREETCLNQMGSSCQLTDLWDSPEIIIHQGNYINQHLIVPPHCLKNKQNKPTSAPPLNF